MSTVDPLHRAMRVPATTLRIITVVVAVAALITVTLVTGLADDRAPAGSQGRMTATERVTNDSP